jgi:hypothetical protein
MRNLKTPIVLLTCSLATSVRAQPSVSGDSVEDRSTVDIDGHVHDHWVARDARGLAIDPEQFYRDVGRPDLIDARANRRTLARTTLVGGLGLMGVSAYFISRAASTHANTRICDPEWHTFSQFAECSHANVEAESAAGRQGGRYMLYAGGAALTGAAVLVISASLFMHPEPVTEEEAERLAADARRRRVTSITPYAEPGGGGLVIAGRF